MSVATRKFLASPCRGAAETWVAVIVAIANDNDELKTDLRSVTGLAASIIADGILSSYPITIVGSGPRLRIYCLYDDDAIANEETDESSLSWNIFESEWKIYFPVEKNDLGWVNKILQQKGSHFAAYQVGEAIKGDEESNSLLPQLTINPENLKKYA